jgi:S1-C subfamily serine protease
MEAGPRPQRPPLGWLGAALVLSIVLGAAAGAVVSLLLDNDDSSKDSLTALLSIDTDEATARIANAALPSVVAIANELERTDNGVPLLAGGAGVIVDNRGFVLTNAHIVQEPGRLTVILANGEERPATLVAHDAPFSDLAIIRIATGGLRALPFGDSDRLVQGQTVMAIGSPDFDYMNSVTAGVVSGVHRRKMLFGTWVDDLIQTDAAINVGNSGGPLINLRGEIVGLISFRDIGQGDPLFGISFAISSRTLLPIIQTMIQRGSYPRPYFGVDHQNVDDALIQTANLRVDRGALVRRVTGGSPADKAGIRVGDVLLRLGRVNIDEQTTFINALAQVGVNERVPVQFWREGRVMETTAEVTPR